MLLVRARLDPAINQGNPATLAALADVVARRQYDVAPSVAASAPLWLQVGERVPVRRLAVRLSWGAGIVTSPLRVLAIIAWLALGATGWRAMRRESPTLAFALGMLVVAGTFGVVVYLNLKAGASLG